MSRHERVEGVPVSEATISDEPGRNRYEMREDGELLGFADYELADRSLVLPHTEIDSARSGRGLGAALVRYVLDDARKRELSVIPYCSFVRDYLDRHPEYRELVPESRRAEFWLAGGGTG